jgi:hypothetical protein
MKRLSFVAALLVASAAPAEAQPASGALSGSAPSPSSFPTAPTQVIGGSEGQAEDLQAKGKCNEAVPILRKLTDGANFVMARFHLGACLLTLADATKDASIAADMRREGTKWILKAANTGFAQAEAEAATICLDGVGMDRDPIEAEKWALIYHHNSLRFVLNLPDVSSDLSDRIDDALTPAARAQAEARADAWTPRTRPDE